MTPSWTGELFVCLFVCGGRRRCFSVFESENGGKEGRKKKKEKEPGLRREEFRGNTCVKSASFIRNHNTMTDALLSK